MSVVQSQEGTPLLRKKTATPLPKFQLFILLWVQLAEPITSQVIYPFINKLVADLPITGGDEAKVGYYAGLIESLFFVTEAFTVLQWSRYSDHVGRKPILLVGLFGLSLSMISFGMSKSFWGLVVSRCLAGLLNGNVGVIKSMMGELTDSTNIAQGMALMPVVWSTGATVGPILGGWLSNPYERFPSTFGRFEFWKTYPYALPCFVVAGYCISSFLLAFFFLDETVKTGKSDTRSEQEGSSVAQTKDKPLPIREVLTPRVVTAVVNYSLLAFLDITLRAIQPLFYTSGIKFGGLGFAPPIVGLCLGAFGLFSGLYQAFVFSPVYNRFGTKKIFVTSILTFIPMFALFPLMNLSARYNGVDALTWVELTLQMILYVLMDMGFSCAFIYVRSAAPNRRSLGATNGLAQTCISVVRAIGPALSSSLYAVSVQRNIFGGWFVYIVLIIASALALLGSAYLPKKLWEVEEDEE
ncbi:MFS general substrate transporter [Athelia psychrophila]|uniref:MFS general substrate transporter n=1 Tax=Athelia psychrophila TaxID=1759441 RepID=A0A166FDU8_9AGAM|nr:MFS general substrate transporter [Fibularhizoctonia sp. CBS 109695]KZP16703.1 MFS general substrate transporter [Fibularhizoctonia sp. CBS 109695]